MSTEQIYQTLFIALFVLGAILTSVKLRRLRAELMDLYTLFELEVYEVERMKLYHEELETLNSNLADQLVEQELGLIPAGPDM